MSDQAPEFTRFCHFKTLPVCPDKVMIPVDDPIHIGVLPPVTEPPTVVGSTTIVVDVEYVVGQGLLVIWARYCHVPAEEGISE